MRSILKWSPMLAVVTLMAACNSTPPKTEIIKEKPLINLKYKKDLSSGDVISTPSNPVLTASAIPTGDAKLTVLTYQLDDGAAVTLKNNVAFTVPVATTGTHKLVLSAQDSSGKTSDPMVIDLLVDASPAVITPKLPTGATDVSGVVGFEFSATDSDSGIASLSVVDASGKSVCQQNFVTKTATLTCNVNTAAYIDGVRNFTLVAINGVGDSNSKTISVTIKNNPETVPPVVNITKIENLTFDNAQGKTFSGNLQVYLDAKDAKGVKNVQLMVNGNPVASRTDTPYVFSIDTTKYDNGDMEISAQATNNLGITAESPMATIKIDNVVPPLFSITSPVNDDPVTGQKQIQLLVTKRNSDFDVVDDKIMVDVYDFRGTLVSSQEVTGVKDSANGTYTTNPVDFSGLLSDFYDIRAHATIKLLNNEGGVVNTQTLNSLVRVSSKVETQKPPSAVILSPIRINSDQSVLPQYVNGMNGDLLMQFSDDSELSSVEVRMTCDNCGPNGPVNALMSQINLKGLSSVTKLLSFPFNGTPNLPDGNYTLRVLTMDTNNKSNIQELKVAINRTLPNIFDADVQTVTGVSPDKFNPKSATYTVNDVFTATDMYMYMYYVIDPKGEIYVTQGIALGSLVPRDMGVVFNESGAWTFGGQIENLTTHQIFGVPGGVVRVFSL